MRRNLTKAEMNDYIHHLEQQVRCMGVLIEAYEKMHKEIREFSENLAGWLALNAEDYCEKYNAWKPESSSDDSKIEPKFANAGKVGQASATTTSILIHLNTTESCYQSYKDDIAFLEGINAEYQKDSESEEENG